MDKPQSKQGERLLIVAFGCFIVAKLLFILLPIEALSIPRNGDDSFYILWGGQQLQQGYDLTLPALADIQMQADLQDGASTVQEWYRSRALFRSVGTHSPALDLVNAAILTLGLPSKWSYAILEIFVALVMGTGIAFFLRQLFGSPAAAAGLILLSFVILPLRGLHYFTASPLVLSIALILWAYMLRCGMQSRLGVLIAGWLVVLATHPLGLVYLCTGLAMLFLAEGGPGDWIRPRALIIGGTLIALATGFQLLTIALPFMGMESAFAGRGLNFGDGLNQNLAAAINFMKRMTNGAGVIVILAGLACFTAARGKVLRRQAGATLTAVILPLILSVFYFYPRYPGEVFGRLLIPLIIILAGAAGAFLAEFYVSKYTRTIRFLVGGATTIFVALTAIPSYQWMIYNLNSRHQIIDEKTLAGQVARFPTKTSILYLNSDITLNATLLAGGDNFGALVGPMLVYSKSGRDLILERRPAVVAITLPRWLNMHAYKGSSALGERRYGISFELVAKLLIGHPQVSRPLQQVHAWVTNRSAAAFDLIVHKNPQSANPPSDAGRRITVPRGYSGWMRLDKWPQLDERKKVQQLMVTLPSHKGWIEGVSFAPPKQNVRWPWTSRTPMAVLERNDTEHNFKGISFSIPELLARKDERPFLPLIRRRDPVLSDYTGIVFLDTVFAPLPGR